MSPVILVSKKLMGSFISLIRKSVRIEILILVVMCSRIQERIKSTLILPRNSMVWAIRMMYTKLRLRVLIPISTTDWVRKGRINCSKLPTPRPTNNCTMSFLYLYR
ncbi:hypothetical protein D3C87_1382440 [compost metagenome]